jgi:hypothetical protein
MHPELLAKTGEAAKSGPIGLAIILILIIVCYFLFKSMSKHLKSVREDFPAGSDAPTHATAPIPPATPPAVADPPAGAADQSDPPPAGPAEKPTA